MVLAKSCDYAIRGLLFLAQRNDPDEPVLLRDIAAKTDMPEAFLSKVFQSLRSSGLVRSHRGRKRGYSLARKARRISLHDVILAIEGPAALRSIPEGSEEGNGDDPLLKVWSQIEDEFVATMKATTLHSMLDHPIGRA